MDNSDFLRIFAKANRRNGFNEYADFLDNTATIYEAREVLKEEGKMSKIRPTQLESWQAYYTSGLLRDTALEPDFNLCCHCGGEIPMDEEICDDCFETFKEDLHGQN